MVGKILLYEFHISYGHTDFLFSGGEMVLAVAEASPIKNKLNEFIISLWEFKKVIIAI